MRRPATTRPPLAPVLAIWGLAAPVGAAVFVTYSRLPPARLYHVSIEGVAGGASRFGVLLSYPVALLALPLLPVVVERLRRTSGVGAGESSAIAALALVAAALCATVGVSVRQSDLDFRPINAVTVAGTLLAAGLTAYVARRTGVGRSGAQRPLAAWAAIALLLLLALPWIGAEIGVSLGRVPVLRTLFNASEHAVHLGDHHGLDGALLAVAAILLWPAVASMVASKLRSLAVFLVSLELVYGVANAVQDAWLEEVVKRGWSHTDIPSLLLPSLTPGWAGIAAGTVALWWLASRALLHGESDRRPTRHLGARTA